MKNNKKVLFYGLTTLVCGSMLLAACGKKEADTAKNPEGSSKVAKKGFPIVDKELDMTVFAPGMGEQSWNKMSILKDYAKKTNIKVKYTTPPNSDFSTKLNLAFASDDLPDVILAGGGAGFKSSMEADYGRQGTLVALEKMIPKYAPNFNKLMKENPDIKKSITTPDGHIYGLPMINNSVTGIWPMGPLWYNGEWMKNLGIKDVPKTTDELYTMLKRFRDEDPNKNGKKDEIPLSDLKMQNARPYLMAAFGLKEQGIDEVNGKVRYTPITENYKAYLEYMHKLYSEKLLDPDTFTQSDDQKKSKGKDDRLGLFQDYYSFFTTGRTQEQAMSDPMFMPLTSEYSKKAIVPGSPRIGRTNFVITKNAASPAAALRWVDYFYSEEGASYINNGPEGIFWNYKKDKDGKKVKVYADGINTENSEDKRGKISPDYGITMPKLQVDGPAIVEKVGDPAITPFNTWVNKETEEKMTPYAQVPYPLVYLTKEEQDKAASIANDLQTYVEQQEAKFITGVEPLSNWDKYVKTIDSMNVKEYVKVYQAAYDRWKK